MSQKTNEIPVTDAQFKLKYPNLYELVAHVPEERMSDVALALKHYTEMHLK